jgi:hypothetical protein
MTPNTLMKTKQELAKLHRIYEILIEKWNGSTSHGRDAQYPETIIMSVLLQNMAFSGVGTEGYSHNEAVEELKQNLKVMNALNEYHNRGYMTHYVYTEASHIIVGMDMTEEIDS